MECKPNKSLFLARFSQMAGDINDLKNRVDGHGILLY
jgi:hypothetical protein